MKKVYVREKVCMGCGLCRVYCQIEHSHSKDPIKTFNRTSFRPVPIIRIERRDQVCLAVQCRHCEQPWCVYSCLTGALRKDPASGVVTVDTEKCIGCWNCVVACPSGALSIDRNGGHIVKCDLWPDQDVPVCVASCPNGALLVGADGSGGVAVR